jgi:hypothetical protein
VLLTRKNGLILAGDCRVIAAELVGVPTLHRILLEDTVSRPAVKEIWLLAVLRRAEPSAVIRQRCCHVEAARRRFAAAANGGPDPAGLLRGALQPSLGKAVLRG